MFGIYHSVNIGQCNYYITLQMVTALYIENPNLCKVKKK